MSTDREREALDNAARLIDPEAFAFTGPFDDPLYAYRRDEAHKAVRRLLAAGWMPRPEPRSDLEAEMAERLWVKLPPHEPPISVVEVQYALRAALGTRVRGAARPDRRR